MIMIIVISVESMMLYSFSLWTYLRTGLVAKNCQSAQYTIMHFILDWLLNFRPTNRQISVHSLWFTHVTYADVVYIDIGPLDHWHWTIDIGLFALDHWHRYWHWHWHWYYCCHCNHQQHQQYYQHNINDIVTFIQFQQQHQHQHQQYNSVMIMIW